MAYFRTCFNCATPRSECATAKRLSALIKGLGLTSVAFKCLNRTPKFRAGQRVSVSWMVHDGGGYDEMPWNLETWPATVSAEVSNKFIILVDDVDSDCGTPARSYVKSANLYCKVSASKLKALDEPDREFCRRCGDIEQGGYPNCYALNGDGELLLAAPSNCARAAIAAATGEAK
jgi:hypothetical protein